MATACCDLCPIMDENRASSVDGCWFGTNGQYYHQKGRRRLPGLPPGEDDTTWVFGLEDRYFPLKRPAPQPPIELPHPPTQDDVQEDEDQPVASSAVDGLTDEMMKFLEMRLAQVATKDSETTGSGHDEASDESSTPAPPVPPRRKRLHRSQSVLSVGLLASKTTKTMPHSPAMSDRVLMTSHVPLIERRIPSSLHSSSSSSSLSSLSTRLGRRGSIAGDVIQRVKRWAAVTSNIRRAFRRVGETSPSSYSPNSRFSLPSLK